MNLFSRFLRFHRQPIGSLILIGSVCALPLTAWVFRGASWPSGEVELVFDLDNTSAPTISGSLNDGSTTWRQVALASMAEWNAHMERTTLVEGESDVPAAAENGVNEIFFASDIYGEPFGEFTLGVTLSETGSTTPHLWSEGDIVLNNSPGDIIWNSYRGNRRFFATDVRRVITHEMGHLIGLGHPDQDSPAQSVTAIMNAAVSDTDLLANDDIDGAVALYSTESEPPEFTLPLLAQTVNVGDLVTFSFEVNGEVPGPDGGDADLSYYWYFPEIQSESWLWTFRDPALFIGAAQPYDAGDYSVFVASGYTANTSTARLTVNPVETSPETSMANLSTRAYAGTGAQTLTVGFVIEGNESKRVLVRAVGPTLGAAPFNLPATHPNPTLTLIKNNEGTVAENDDWSDNSMVTASEIADVTASAGGFALPEGSLDAVLLVDLEPGVYTAQVTGAEGDEGLVIVEAYDVSPPGNDARLTNLSTRGFVGTGTEIMIAGLVVEGPGPRTYLIRAAGDTLGEFGIEGYLDDTFLTLYQGQTVLRVVDDWDDPAAHQDMLRDAMESLGAFALIDRQESALKITLYPGAYTVQISGFDDLTGVALVEVYEFPEE